jgi:hypothetical protein
VAIRTRAELPDANHPLKGLEVREAVHPPAVREAREEPPLPLDLPGRLRVVVVVEEVPMAVYRVMPVAVVAAIRRKHIQQALSREVFQSSSEAEEVVAAELIPVVPARSAKSPSPGPLRRTVPSTARR